MIAFAMVSMMSISMLKGKDIWKMLTIGAIFSTFKHTDPHTVRCRSILKDCKIIERIIRYRSFRALKIAKESNDLLKVLLEPN